MSTEVMIHIGPQYGAEHGMETGYAHVDVLMNGTAYSFYGLLLIERKTNGPVRQIDVYQNVDDYDGTDLDGATFCGTIDVDGWWASGDEGGYDLAVASWLLNSSKVECEAC